MPVKIHENSSARFAQIQLRNMRCQAKVRQCYSACLKVGICDKSKSLLPYLHKCIHAFLALANLVISTEIKPGKQHNCVCAVLAAEIVK